MVAGAVAAVRPPSTVAPAAAPPALRLASAAAMSDAPLPDTSLATSEVEGTAADGTVMAPAPGEAAAWADLRQRPGQVHRGAG